MLKRETSFTLIVITVFLVYVAIILGGEVVTLNRHVDPCPPLRIYLYSNKSGEPYRINSGDSDSLRKAPFVKGLPVKLIIPGYATTTEELGFGLLVPAYKNNGHYNVLYVTYLFRHPLHICEDTTSAKNLSACIYRELKMVFKLHHINLHNVHLVSASLGVVLAGYITQLFGDEKMSRLTGLDPAYMTTLNPCVPFTITDKYPVSSESAHFVDIHHTNMFYLGDGGLRGHVDIIYNNGVTQEVCNDSDQVADILVNVCSHKVIIFYYAESIYTKIDFWGKPCQYIFDPYAENNTGMQEYRICEADGSKEEVLIGESMSHKTRGFYHVKTNSFYPYAKGKTLQ